MAEIPVERKEKSALPWWLIPLLLLGLLLLIFLLYRGCSDNATVVGNTNANRANGAVNSGNANMSNAANANTSGAMVNGANNTAIVVNNNTTGANANGAMNSGAGSGDLVTAVNYYGTVQDKATIVGRNVDLRAAQVNRVLSDRVFTVKSENQEMFVMLDENLDSGGGKEQQIKIRPGQTLKLGGAFRSVPTAEVKDEAQNRDLNKKEYAQMKDQKVYLHATSVSDVR